MTELFIEWSSSTYHTALLIPDSVDMGKGFRSLYKYDSNQKSIIEAQASMANLDNMAVYSDTLFIDIDNNEDAMKAMRFALVDRDIHYELYESGGKGYHFHIPLKETYQHTRLPEIQKQWVKSLGIPVDESIYKHAGLFRLPGQRHAKTGKKKEIIAEQCALLLELDMNIQLPTAKPTRMCSSLSTSAEALNECLFYLINEPAEGGRYMKLWHLAKGLQEAEFTEEFAIELLVEVNFAWSKPKPIEEINRAIKETYGKAKK